MATRQAVIQFFHNALEALRTQIDDSFAVIVTDEARDLIQVAEKALKALGSEKSAKQYTDRLLRRLSLEMFEARDRLLTQTRAHLMNPVTMIEMGKRLARLRAPRAHHMRVQAIVLSRSHNLRVDPLFQTWTAATKGKLATAMLAKAYADLDEALSIAERELEAACRGPRRKAVRLPQERIDAIGAKLDAIAGKSRYPKKEAFAA